LDMNKCFLSTEWIFYPELILVLTYRMRWRKI
jgi:hypothetical protein